MTLRLIEGGSPRSDPPYYVSETPEDDAPEGCVHICFRTNEIVMTGQGPMISNRVIEGPVRDRAAAEAFCAALNAMWLEMDDLLA